MWKWASSAPGRGGGGACHDERKAREDAEEWMLDNHAPSARVAPVNLDALEPAYVPAGDAIVAARDDGNRITWQPESL
jgi:hypothetical protein